MPSCVTESDESRCSVSCLAYFARLLPSAMSVSRREVRIFTQQNSAATKNPFIKIRKMTSNKSSNVGNMSTRYILLRETKGAAALLRHSSLCMGSAAALSRAAGGADPSPCVRQAP